MHANGADDEEDRGLIYEQRVRRDAGGYRLLGLSKSAASCVFCAMIAAVLLLAGANLSLLTQAPADSVAPDDAAAVDGPRFAVAFPSTARADPLDGRLLLLLSRRPTPEPRFQVGFMRSHAIVQVFGKDFEGLRPDDEGEGLVLDAAGDEGYPLFSTSELVPGEYYVQAVLHRYETFHLSTGHTVLLPPGDGGDGQNWARAPGNLYSTPRRITIGAEPGQTVQLVADQLMPEIAPAEDTEWVRHVTVRSELLSTFFGRDVNIGAHVLLPLGFDDHPEARYPLLLNHGHYPHDFGPSFRSSPPDASLPEGSRQRRSQQRSYDFTRRWQSEGLPRYLAVTVQHPTPYFDDSYAVNSASEGPWGDAIMYELLPEVERRFRGIGEGWARFTYGCSTGGWVSLAVQVFYPDDFNGCFSGAPDPIDFRAISSVNLYDDANVYWYSEPEGAFFAAPGAERDGGSGRVMRPINRDSTGNLRASVRDGNWLERALGSKGRSGGQYDIWQAVYSPQGSDGYPAPIFNKLTGEIDKRVAEYWRENYDLTHIMERDWATLGPKLQGKLHIYCGDMDTYYLNNAVYYTEEFLKRANASTPGGIGYEVIYGDRKVHCWDLASDKGEASHTAYIDRIMARIETSAPAGADLSSWRYAKADDEEVLLRSAAPTV